MNTQQIQNTVKKVQRTTGSFWLWLGLGIVLFIAALAIKDVSRRAAIIPNTSGSPFTAQSVPEAGAQGVADYIRAHSNPSAQAVPDASAQGVANYLQAHSVPYLQTVPDAAVQSVTDYLRLHGTGSVITDPAAKSVMDYLKAHGIQP